MRTTEIQATPCAGCGWVMDRASHAYASPKAGDIVVCLHCSHVSIYQVDGTLRSATDEEVLSLDAGSMQEVARLQRSILSDTEGVPHA